MKELIVTVQDEVENILLVENGILTEKYVDSKYKKRLEGNIYIGKVQNIFPGLQAAFINVGENRNAFIHLKDVLPKVDVTKEENVDIDKQNIGKILKVGMPIIVEIKRDSYNKKGARASTHINLPGRYLVLLPNSTFVTISQKIEDEKERERLKKIVREKLPENMGAIIRTSAVNKSAEDLEKAMKNEIDKKGLSLFVLAITDILNSNSEIIALGEKAAVTEKAFNKTLENNTMFLEGVVSRKKQLLPNIDKNM